MAAFCILLTINENPEYFLQTIFIDGGCFARHCGLYIYDFFRPEKYERKSNSST